jgi:hypothetical protein
MSSIARPASIPSPRAAQFCSRQRSSDGNTGGTLMLAKEVIGDRGDHGIARLGVSIRFTTAHAAREPIRVCANTRSIGERQRYPEDPDPPTRRRSLSACPASDARKCPKTPDSTGGNVKMTKRTHGGEDLPMPENARSILCDAKMRKRTHRQTRAHARIGFTSLPWTSVRRKLRPWNL